MLQAYEVPAGDSIAPGLYQSQVDHLKKIHGQVFLIEVDSDVPDSPFAFVFKKPDRKILSAVAKIGQNDQVEATFLLLRNCLVWGDAALLDSTDVFTSVSQAFETVVQPKVARIKNL